MGHKIRWPRAALTAEEGVAKHSAKYWLAFGGGAEGAEAEGGANRGGKGGGLQNQKQRKRDPERGTPENVDNSST